MFYTSAITTLRQRATGGERSGSVSHLKGADGGALETQVGLEVLGDLPDQPLEGQLADQQLGGLLVATDLSESHGTRPNTKSNQSISKY